jgi:uncharacterized DUF497 family protein
VIRFEWDPEKARTNLAKHGVTFEDAQLVWGGSHHTLRFDRHEGGEERWQFIGYARGVVILVVCHTYPGPNDKERVRIGARKARRTERRARFGSPSAPAALPDELIDTSDLSAIEDWSLGVRGGTPADVRRKLTASALPTNQDTSPPLPMTDSHRPVQCAGRAARRHRPRRTLIG